LSEAEQPGKSLCGKEKKGAAAQAAAALVIERRDVGYDETTQ
jgi:hypothetical protein